jgi:serine/threonine-protein kinase HipA
VVQGEFIAMRLARLAGLDVADVELTEAIGKQVLLVRRFDRDAAGHRRSMVSALTILQLAEHEARYASYADLARTMRERFAQARKAQHELFARITFSILTGNTDDHARNHAAFWNGRELALTPAYDICPQRRGGGETKQVMAIGEDGWRHSQLEGCVQRAGSYHLTEETARAIIDRQIETIETRWDEVCDEAGLGEIARHQMLGSQFLNPYAFYGYRGRVPRIIALPESY